MTPFKFFRKSQTANVSDLSPVFSAIYKGKIDQLKKLLQADPQQLFELSTDSNRSTTLHFAAQRGNYPVCEFLLSQPNSTPQFINTKDAKGRNCLHLAASGYNHELIGLFLNLEALDVGALTLEEDTVFHLLGKFFPVVTQETIKQIIQARHPFD